MKKIEEEFLNDFSDSFPNQQSFEDVMRKITPYSHQKKTKQSHKLFIKKLGFIGALVLLFAILIPLTIAILNKPQITAIAIANLDDLVVEYEKNCQFIDKGVAVDKIMSNGKQIRASSEEIVIDYQSFQNSKIGEYYISVYLRNKPSSKTGYYVRVIDDEVIGLELINSRTTYYMGEIIAQDDLIIEKTLASGARKRTKYTECSVDTSNFDSQQIGTYEIAVALNSNEKFNLSYEVEVQDLDHLDVNGKYGCVDSYIENTPPTILALEIKDDKVISHYSEIIIGDNEDTKIKKEVVDGQIIISDSRYNQKMTYKPLNNELIITGLMAGEPDIVCFRLQDNDYLISLEGLLADQKTLYVAKGGSLSSDTISYLTNAYGGIYLDSEMEIPITIDTIFERDTTIFVGTKIIENDEKLYMGTFYDENQKIALRIEENSLYMYGSNTPNIYSVQLRNNGDIWIRTSAYDPIYHYIVSKDIFEVYSGDNYYIGILRRFDADRQVIVTLSTYSETKYEYAWEKGTPFRCINVHQNEIEYFTIPGYSKTPINEDTIFNNVTISHIYMSDFSYRIYGSHDDYLTIRNAWSAGKENINNELTYWYEIRRNYEADEIGWIEFSKSENNTITFILHPENGDSKTAIYEKTIKSFTIDENKYTYNSTPFSDFDFVGLYLGDDGSEKTISEKGMLGTIKYSETGSVSTTYTYIYISSLNENEVIFSYVYQNENDEREIRFIALTKKESGWSFIFNGITYLQLVNP